ncbi:MULTISPECIES: DUF6915 family protein [Acidiphilium]|uniref:DUF6915 family protein n=1 Tax=Acidiphilium TaxID=522 RepID=UPI0038CD7A95
MNTRCEGPVAHPYHHAVSSARQWGSAPDDYQAIHDFLDSSKAAVADFPSVPMTMRHEPPGNYT